MLIATLPSLHQRELTGEMFSNPFIGGVRYNIGGRSKYSPEETVHILSKYAEKHDKMLWIDLKGRQLRITKWADPTYGDIELNRKISVDLPANVCFRGDETTYILDDYDENKLFIYPDPLHALGAGQALNIMGVNFNIIGDYLSPADVTYIKASRDAGVHNYMLSFAERSSDIQEILSIDAGAKSVLKIESVRGLGFVETMGVGEYHLMAARDDLSINLEKKSDIINHALSLIIHKDNCAIAASKIFESLKHGVTEDYSDIKNLTGMGYSNFMLDDTISHRYFKGAIKLWQEWVK
jgi:pyruvate kinase